VSRLKGTEKLGRLYDYTVEIATKDDIGLTVHEARDMVQVDALVGKQVTVKIAIEGSGTYETGKIGVSSSVSVGAGEVEIQAQGDEMALAALKDLTISSTDGRIILNAAKEIWIGAGGSYIQINGSGIVNATPGKILEKCASWSKPGADSKRLPLPTMPQGNVKTTSFYSKSR